MIQIYVLSILFNIVAGYFLAFGERESSEELRTKLTLASMKDETFKLILGILAMVIGLLKLLSPVEGNIPVVGDIIPAAAGLTAGFVLIYEYYKGRAIIDDDTDGNEKLGALLVRNKRIVGFVVIAAAILHFLFPGALFL